MFFLCFWEPGRGGRDVGSGIDDYLTIIRGIGIDLLVAGHAGVETDFSAGGADLSDRHSFQQQAILEEEVRFMTHWKCGWLNKSTFRKRVALRPQQKRD
jgi:hypothetical protein